MRIKSFVTVALAASVMLFAASRAEATLQISMQEAGVNGGAITSVATTASDFTAVFFNGSYGDFSISIVGASSDNGASLSDLLSAATNVHNNSGTTQTLHIWVSQTNYTLPIGPKLNVEAGMGGSLIPGTTLNLNGVFQAFADTSNALNGTGTAAPIQTAAPNGSSFDTGSAFGVFTRGAGAFSLTTEANLQVSGGGSVNYSNHVDLTAVPEPASMVLLGSGLLGLAMSARRRRKQ